jgi:uncharacterized repeat protein (TIGR01451 family)
MKKLLLLLALAIVQISYSQNVNIPDANFKAALIADGVDTNNDGEIQVSEAEAITEISVINKNISSLEGISSFTNLTYLNCNENELESIDLSGLLALKEVYCNWNQLTSLVVSGLTNLEKLKCENNSLQSLDLSGLVNLKELQFGSNQITTTNLINLQNLSNLELLYCGLNQLTSLDVSSLSNLKKLGCSANLLTSLNVSNLNNLTSLSCGANQLTQLDVSDLINLKELICDHNQLNSLDISNLNLNYLVCQNNQLTSLDISMSSDLVYLTCQNNQLTSLQLSSHPILEYLNCLQNQLTTLDVSNCPRLQTLNCTANQLQSLFMKNGVSENFVYLDYNPSLEYICVDSEERESIQNIVDIDGYTNCVVSSYCTFIPGGNPSYITGNVKLDLDNNGCDTNDIGFGDLKLKITNSANLSDTYSTNADGSYSIALPEDSYTVEYVLENPSYFNVSLASFAVDFPTDNSPYQQDFCLTANGVIQDLEIQIIPLEQARPGFDAEYKIVYKNNGTSTVSGNITLTYQDEVLDFVDATPNESSASPSLLSWAYTNLTPSESREILVTMNLNTPTETPPLNGDDILCYDATITPITNDQRTNDNTFSLKQTVVNSYDPNDKTCLEGNTVTPDIIGEYVHYLIRFENTGTASAINVVVKDLIDASMFDPATLVAYDASHAYRVRIQNTNEVEFIFEGINLPFDDASNDGYIAFKIKTLPTLSVGDVLENSAEIYFDFNFPIITNNEQTAIETTASTDHFSLNSNITAYPNPTKDILHIKSTLAFDAITFYDLKGRALKTISSTSPLLTKSIDVADLASGIYYVSIHAGKSKKLLKFIRE